MIPENSPYRRILPSKPNLSIHLQKGAEYIFSPLFSDISKNSQNIGYLINIYKCFFQKLMVYFDTKHFYTTIGGAL